MAGGSGARWGMAGSLGQRGPDGRGETRVQESQISVAEGGGVGG